MLLATLVAGVGAVVGHDRNATPLPQSIVPKKAAPRKRKPAPKKKVVVVQEVESESSEGSDFDSSDSSSGLSAYRKPEPRMIQFIRKCIDEKRA